MNSTQKHILILCSRLDLPGGTERAIVNTANLFTSYGNQVTIFILDEPGKSFFAINDSVNVHTYQLHFGITDKGTFVGRKIGLLKHLLILRERIRKVSPDLIITTEYHFTIAAGLVIRSKEIPIFSWEHHHFHWIKRNRFWSFLHKRIYPRITAIVALNETEKQLFIHYGCNAVVIPNFVSPQKKALLNNHVLLSVGWLNWRKGVDLIPAIAEKVFRVHADWEWHLIGTGDKEEELKRILKEKELNEKVRIIEPSSPNLDEDYAEASIYVMISRFECFPMVLLEAISFGVPCISFNCPTGPSDIIRNNVDGVLVENQDIDAMANSIINLIEDDIKRKQMGANAFENSQRFSAEAIYQLWVQIFRLL